MIGEIGVVREYFDGDFYRNMNKELSDLSEHELLLHYYYIGWKEGRWPNSWFDQEEYIETYPCIKQYNINPLLHYAINEKCNYSKE